MKVTVDVPKDFAVEGVEWNLLVSRFVRRKVDELAHVESIISASEASEEDVDALSDDVKAAIAGRF